MRLFEVHYSDGDSDAFVGMCFATDISRAIDLAFNDIVDNTSEIVSKSCFKAILVRETLGARRKFIPHAPTVMSLFGYKGKLVNC